jgi:hypothetical protein
MTPSLSRGFDSTRVLKKEKDFTKHFLSSYEMGVHLLFNGLEEMYILSFIHTLGPSANAPDAPQPWTYCATLKCSFSSDSAALCLYVQAEVSY